MLGLDWEGQAFRDRFLIADIHMKSDFPTERWFWFDPPFHPNQSALLHRQADDVWRIDFQLGWDADPDEEKKPERILPRLRAMLGRGRRVRDRMGERLHVRSAGACSAFAMAACSSPATPRTSCRRSARAGANSGIQDADNLVWKLDARARRARRRSGCSTPTTSSACAPPTRTS